MAGPVTSQRLPTEHSSEIVQHAHLASPKGVAFHFSSLESAARDNTQAGESKSMGQRVSQVFNNFCEMLGKFFDAIRSLFKSGSGAQIVGLQVLQNLLDAEEPNRDGIVAAFGELADALQTAVKNHMRDAIVGRLTGTIREQYVAFDNLQHRTFGDVSYASFQEIEIPVEELGRLHESLRTDVVTNPLSEGSFFRRVLAKMEDSPHKQELVALLNRDDVNKEAIRNFFQATVERQAEDHEGNLVVDDEGNAVMEDIPVEGRGAFVEALLNNMALKLARKDAVAKGTADYTTEMMGDVILGGERVIPQAEGEAENAFAPYYLNAHLLDQGGDFRTAVAAVLQARPA